MSEKNENYNHSLLKNKSNEQKSSKKVLGKKERKFLIVAGILLCITLIVGVSYAWWSYTTSQKSTNIIKSDCLKLELVDETSAIKLEKSYPLTDTEASHLAPYTFTIKNVCNTSLVYDVELDIMNVLDAEGNDIRLKSEYIAISFDGAQKKMLDTLESVEPKYNENEYTPVEGKLLAHGELLANESKSYTLKLWIDEHVTVEDDAMNKEFISKIVISASLNQITEYQESILNGAYPVLADNLVPVEIDDTGKVTKADITKEWYSYEEKKWANAVILLDKTIEYQENEEIPESNIESYFVWIPKYSYELWDLGNYTALGSINSSKVHTIPIKFGTENTSDANSGECTTPMESGATGNCKVGDYMTPPAFISMGTNGLWVGKFETGYKGAASTTAAQVNASDASKIQIKPNVYSWRNIQPANAHLASYNYQRELDSHMMKNTEWGAVAYLQHSKYGSATSVRINNNSAYITGYAAKNEPTTGYTGTNIAGNIYESTNLGVDGTNTYNYKNTLSQVASTTGNYTGIYDMSGGTWEYMMSVMLDSTNSAPLSGRNATYHSNFNGVYSEGGAFTGGTNFPSSRYLDTYTYSTAYTNFNRRILGDGTGEFGPHTNITYATNVTRQVGSWYADEGWFVSSTAPWFLRGGDYYIGLGAGVFDFYHAYGNATTDFGFRVVLAV